MPGRTNSFLYAQVRARVDGIVLRRDFIEGSDVKVGQRLYKIDPAPYIAALNNAKASLAKAQANVVTQNALVARYKVLVAANAVSKQDYDNAVAAQGQAVADVAAGRPPSIPRRSTSAIRTSSRRSRAAPVSRK